MNEEQQAQLQMNVGAHDEEGDVEAEDAVSMLQVTLLQGDKTKYSLDEDRGYLDGCSTVTAFKNAKHLKNIHKSDDHLKVNCNAGAVIADEIGSFGGLQVWYMPEGIANIFSMPELEKQYRITYDS